MTKVKTPWETLPMFYILGFGIPFCIIGVLFLDSGVGSAFLANGVVWLTLGTAVKLKCVWDKRRLKHLKAAGIRFEGTITQILPNSFIRIGSYVTSCVMCSYIGESGRISVKSNAFLLTAFDRKETLRAMIYIDPADSRRCKIELYRVDE